MITNKQLAKDLIVAYFQDLANKDRINAEGLAELFNINSDDRYLLEHIKAWISILNKAKEEIENEQKN